MTPQQYAEVAAQILKDRAGKLGDYQELYENLAARLNLSFKKLKPGERFYASDAVKFHIENKLARMDCGEANSDHNLDGGNYFYTWGVGQMNQENSRIFVKPGSAKLSANLSNPKIFLK